MSVKLMTYVFDHVHREDSTEKLLLLCLADQASEESGECWPSVSTLARRVNRTTRQVRRILSKFETEGLISRTPRVRPASGSQTSNVITLCWSVDEDNRVVERRIVGE